jgi:hypothetical protein
MIYSFQISDDKISKFEKEYTSIKEKDLITAALSKFLFSPVKVLNGFSLL